MFGQLSVHTIESLVDDRLRELRHEADQHRLGIRLVTQKASIWPRAAWGLGYRLVALGEWLIARPSGQVCADQG